MDRAAKRITLEDVLTEKQLGDILKKTSKTGFKLLKYDIRPTSEGMCGFVGDHTKTTLHFKDGDFVKKVHLFIKTVPHANFPKAKFINDNNFFRREMTVYNMFDEMPDDLCPDPWGVRAFVCNDDTLVLPDLSLAGYKTYPAIRYLDTDHVIVALTSLARFHAAFANHQSLNGNSNNKITDDVYNYFDKDTNFYDGPWLRAAVKCTANFLKEFSANIERYPTNLSESITKWFTEACDSIKEYENTLNVVIHKDLWANNILFKYDGSKPSSAILIDFQCARYAPPALDVMIFIYYTTSRNFREQKESEVLNHYYSVFSESIDEATKRRSEVMNYDRQTFLVWCDKLRPGGMLVPLSIYPFILMPPIVAQEVFDEPESFERHYFEDRTAPVLATARDNEYYRSRLLEISEEFVERHLKL